MGSHKTVFVAHYCRIFTWLVAHHCTIFCNIGFILAEVVGYHKTVFVAKYYKIKYSDDCTLFCNI